MYTDSIADMLIRIKNALTAGHNEVTMPHSKMREAIANILLTEKYISEVELIDVQPQKELKLSLKYEGSLPVVSGVKRVSKPGRRLYASSGQIPATLGGYGITILSTNQGVITDKEARQKNIGGEILCQVW